MIKTWAYFLLILSILPISATADKGPLSLAFDVQPIFDSYCVQCHMLEVAQAGLVLEDGEAYANLVGVRSSESTLLRVIRGNPENSYLIKKLRGTHIQAGGAGLGMPLVEGTYEPLSKRDIEAISHWIALGAKDN